MTRARTITRAKWRAARTPGQMNKTERRFADRLRELEFAGEVVQWDFEPIKLRLGADWKTTLTVDFMVCHADGLIELIDVKGSGPIEQVAMVKLKTAARLYPAFLFVVMQETKTLGTFNRQEIPHG